MGVPIPEHATLLSFNQRPNIQWYYYLKKLLHFCLYIFSTKILGKNYQQEQRLKRVSTRWELRIIARWGRVNRVTNYGSTDFSHNH